MKELGNILLKLNYILVCSITFMISDLLSCLFSSEVEIRILWLVCSLFIAYQLGYYCAKRKYDKFYSQSYRVSSHIIIPYEESSSKQSTFKLPLKLIQKDKKKSEKEWEPEVYESSEPSSPQHEPDSRIPSELLKERVNLEQMKKLKSTSFLQIRVESSKNSRFMRKIEKHELVTDYQTDPFEGEGNQLVVIKQNPISALSEPHSLLEVIAHQDHNLKLASPIITKRFINASHFNSSWKDSEVASWLTETGRFCKFFRRSKPIGKGGFGSVFNSWSIYDEKEYAIKKIIVNNSSKLNNLMNEVSIISKYHHPNIVIYHTCWIELANLDELNQLSIVVASNNPKQKQVEDENISANYVSEDSGFVFQNSSNKSKPKSPSKKIEQQIVLHSEANKIKKVEMVPIYTLHIQMELCQGSLYDYLSNREEINRKEGFKIMSEIISGLHFLHSNGIVHRDLKPGNILLSDNKKQIKIGDFGLATLIENNQQNVFKQKAGTPQYMAPQLNSGLPILKDQMYLADIFSLGVIYYEILNLFNQCTQHQRIQKINLLQVNTVQLPSKELKQERKFIKLLTKSLALRPTIAEVLSCNQFLALKTKYSQE